MAISSQGVQLLYGPSASALTELCRIKDYPDLIGAPNLIDVTDLTDTQQTNIPGVLTSDVLTFLCNYDKTAYTAAEELASTPGYYALRLRTGEGWTWQGEHTIGVPGEGVDNAIEFQVHCTNSTPIVYSEQITIADTASLNTMAAKTVSAAK